MKDFKNSTRMQTGHAFPSASGFTGSTGKLSSIGPYTRRSPKKGMKNKFDDGGKVDMSDTDRPPGSSPTGRRETSPGFGGAIKDAVSAVSDYLAPRSIKSRKSTVDDAVDKASTGYAKGGKKRYAKGGDVGQSTTQRSHAVNDLDAETGGKTPLRPGFKRGGVKKAMGGPVTMKKGGKHPGALHQAAQKADSGSVKSASKGHKGFEKAPMFGGGHRR